MTTKKHRFSGPFAARWLAALLLSLALTMLTFVAYLSRLNLNPWEAGSPAQRSLWISLRSDQADRLSLEYDTSPRQRVHWDPDQSVSAPAQAGEQTLRFDLPAGRIYRLRLNLGAQPGEKIVSQVGIVTGRGNACQWPGGELRRFLPYTSAEVDDLMLLGDGLHVFTTGPAATLANDTPLIESECDARLAQSQANRAFQGLAAGLLFVGLSLGFGAVLRRGVAPADLAVVALGLFLLALPLSSLFLRLGNEAPNPENRRVAAWPEAPHSLADWVAWPPASQAYFTDHYGWRNELIQWSNQFRAGWLATSPQDLVVIGQAGWLYLDAENCLLDYQGLAPLNEKDLAHISANLTRARKRANPDTARFLVVVAPDKHTIYPEHLPANLRKVQPGTRLDQLLDYNRSHARLPILDLRPVLLEAKTHDTIYYRTDTHWNYLGAFYAYQEIIRTLHDNFPALKAHDLADYEIIRSEIPGLGLAPMISMQNRWRETEVQLIPRFQRRAQIVPLGYPLPGDRAAVVSQVDDPTLPSAVVFHDSFALALIPYLQEHFSRVVFIRSYRVDEAIIARENPDIVITEFVERMIGAMGE